MKLYETCIRCGRKLTSQASKELGFGRVCWEKWQTENILKPLFTEQGVLNERTDDVDSMR